MATSHSSPNFHETADAAIIAADVLEFAKDDRKYNQLWYAQKMTNEGAGADAYVVLCARGDLAGLGAPVAVAVDFSQEPPRATRTIPTVVGHPWDEGMPQTTFSHTAGKPEAFLQTTVRGDDYLHEAFVPVYTRAQVEKWFTHVAGAHVAANDDNGWKPSALIHPAAFDAGTALGFPKQADRTALVRPIKPSGTAPH